MKLFLVLTLISITQVNSANILCYFVAASISHQKTFQPIWLELASRGHNVTVITPDPTNEKLQTLREIDIHDVSYRAYEKANISTLGTTEDRDGSDINEFIKAYLELVPAQLRHPEVAAIFQNKQNDTYDLIIMEFPTFQNILSHVYPNVPIIGISSMPMLDIGHQIIGNPVHLITHPDMNLPFSRNLTFWERLQTVSYWFRQKILMFMIREVMVELAHKGGLTWVTADMYSEECNVSMVFVNRNPALHTPRPNVPSVIDISGVHIQKPKQLPKELMEFMNNSKEGVIYISFGSSIKSSKFKKEKVQLFLDAIASLPYKVLWKFEEGIPNLSNNLKIIKWAPQQDILRHPNTKAFVTQGGLQSWEEALYAKVPMMVIPFFGDQFGNARKIEEIGMGKQLNFFKLTNESLASKILEVANDETMRENLENLYNIATDQPMTGLERAIWWIEYVIRHKGARHFRSPLLDVPTYQYYFVDVAIFVISILVLTIWLIYFIMKLLIKLIKLLLRKLNKNKEKSN